MSNHELAKKYSMKMRLLGLSSIRYRLGIDDKVILTDISEDLDVLKIPKFITNIEYKVDDIRRNDGDGPLKFKKVSCIDIDMNGNKLDISGLCIGVGDVGKLVVNIRGVGELVGMEYLFAYSQVREIELHIGEQVDISNIKSIKGIFKWCYKLEKIDIFGLDRLNVEDISELYCYCKMLKRIDIGWLKTNKVTKMRGLFDCCEGLEYIDVSRLDTSKVVDMSSMFSECESLEELDISNFDTRNVRFMQNMFYGCTGLKELDVSKFNTSKVENM